MALLLPTPKMQTIIRQAVNEDINTRYQDLERIKEWLNKQPHLPKDIDDQRLLNFLRGCSFSLEKCKRKLDMYFTMRGTVPEFFTNRDISRPEMREILDYAYAIYMPKLTSDGKRVCVAGSTRTDMETPDIANFFKFVLMVNDVRLETEEFGVAGEIYVLDASVALVKHFVKVSPMAIKRFLICVQHAYPNKIKEVHIINVTPLVDMIINTFKTVLSEKLRSRIHVHSKNDTLYEYVSKEILPEEFGGAAGKIENLKGSWLRKLEEYVSWFKEQERVVANESLRPIQQNNFNDLLGLDGSFRKLNID